MVGAMDAPGNRDDAGRFPPGVSGNPSGRAKKLPELAAKISLYDDEMVKRLLSIARSTLNDKNSIAAIRLLLSYAHGNPVQAITGGDGEPLFDNAERAIAALKKLAGE